MDRKTARTAWKERKPDRGIYRVRLDAGDWVGATTELSAAENRLRFTLSNGGCSNAALAQAYETQGAFHFEVLERLPADIAQFALKRRLKDRLDHWRLATGANLI